MESANTQLTPEAIFTPNPPTKRAQRTKINFKNSSDEHLLAYGSGSNLIMKNLKDHTKNHVFNQMVNSPVTVAKYSNKGYYVAFGDERGGIKIIGWSGAEKAWLVKMENENMLGGKINDICWSDDDKKLAIVGCGPKRACAINIETKNTVGEVVGHNGDLLTCDLKITRPFKFVIGGEDREINYYKAMPMGHLKSIQNIHNNFIQKVAFTPDNWDKSAHFITVSSDKSIKVHNCESYELVVEKQGAHSMGIIDMCFTGNPWEISTCSSDRTVRTFKIDLAAKTIEQVKEYTLSDFDLEGYKDNVDKQQLGLAYSKIDTSFYCVSNNGDINVWKENESEKPVNTIRGHQSPVSAVAVFNDKLIISGCNDGRILAWNPADGSATRPIGTFKLKITISTIKCNSKFVYAACNDNTLMALKMSDTDNTLASIDDTMTKKDSNIAQMIATEEILYILYTNKTIEAVKADLITEIIAKSDKLDSLGGKGEATAMGLCTVNGELWIGDKQGKIHIFDATTLKLKEECDLATEYGKEVSMFASSNDKGKLMAVGDKDGYVTFFDAETKVKKNYVAFNSKKIIAMEFIKDDSQICSLSIDKMVSLGPVEGKGKPIKLGRPNGMKDTNDMCLFYKDGNTNVLTAGDRKSVV